MDNDYPQRITAKILLSPTGKDFQSILTFLLRLLDPSFSLSSGPGKMEDEVHNVFKSLRYPFQISKTALTAVGAQQSWPAVMGAVMWLLEVVEVRHALQLWLSSLHARVAAAWAPLDLRLDWYAQQRLSGSPLNLCTWPLASAPHTAVRPPGVHSREPGRERAARGGARLLLQLRARRVRALPCGRRRQGGRAQGIRCRGLWQPARRGGGGAGYPARGERAAARRGGGAEGAGGACHGSDDPRGSTRPVRASSLTASATLTSPPLFLLPPSLPRPPPCSRSCRRSSRRGQSWSGRWRL